MKCPHCDKDFMRDKTPIDLKKMIALKNKGLSVNAIAKHLGFSYSAIYRAFKQNGIDTSFTPIRKKYICEYENEFIDV